MQRFFVCTVLLGLVLSSFTSCIEDRNHIVQPYFKPLEIIKISEKSYLHTSFIKQDNGEFIPCNGYIYINDGAAIVFDTPLNDSISKQLINFVQEDLYARIEGVVINHFHYDASGGLGAFNAAGIPSYASKKTAKLLREDSLTISNPFEDLQRIDLKDATIENRYFGPAHSNDNIISYVHNERVIYGGCMIKSLHAKKGNLADADVAAWPETVSAIKKAYPDATLVIPGHGQTGGQELLEYTIHLFQPASSETIANLD